MPPLLECRDLRASYGDTTVLHGISLVVPEGGVTAVLGANGAGKTTALRAVCGMVRTRGEIHFRGRAIAGRATAEIARSGVAHVPDGRGTFVELSVQDNLRLGAITRRDKAVPADMERVFGYFPRMRRSCRGSAMDGLGSCEWRVPGFAPEGWPESSPVR